MSANALAGQVNPDRQQNSGQQTMPEQNIPAAAAQQNQTFQPPEQSLQPPVDNGASQVPKSAEGDIEVSPAELPEFEQTQQETSEVIKKFGLDPSAIEKEWFQNNSKLSEDSYKAFEAKGIPRSLVDQHGRMLEQRQAQQFKERQETVKQAEAAYVAAVDAHTGGREQTQELFTFLNSGAVPAQEQTALFTQLDSGDIETAKIAINRIKTLHELRYGRAGKPLNGGDYAYSGGGDVFTSGDEAFIAYKACEQGDPRQVGMRRKLVMEKLFRTNQLRAARGQQPLQI